MNKKNRPHIDEDNLPEESFTTEDAQRLDFPSRSELENQLTALEMRLEEYKNASFRAQAEAENVRKRSEREVSQAHKFGQEKLLMDLLPILDSLVRGLEGPESRDPHLKAMREGMKLTLQMFEKTLEKHGLQPIMPAKGDVFDPQFHQAMAAQSDPNAKPNTILEVLQKGYQLNGRVLRAAMVIVAQ